MFFLNLIWILNGEKDEQIYYNQNFTILLYMRNLMEQFFFCISQYQSQTVSQQRLKKTSLLADWRHHSVNIHPAAVNPVPKSKANKNFY